MNSKILEAVDVLKKHGNRRMAADLLSQELHEGSEHGERWRSFGLLASRIGETEMALEGARRFMTTPPVTVGKIVAYCDDLVGAGRKAQAIEFLNKLPKDALQHAHVLHFMGNLAAQEGEFAKSRELLRKSLSLNPNAPLVWHAYGMSDDSPLADDDFRILLSLKKTADRLDLRNRAAYYYALGDAYAKLGDAERAFAGDRLYRKCPLAHRFRADAGGSWLADWDEVTGAPNRIWGSGVAAAGTQVRRRMVNLRFRGQESCLTVEASDGVSLHLDIRTMSTNGESPTAIAEQVEYLKHVHTGGVNLSFAGPNDGIKHTAYAGGLKDIGYEI